MEQIKFSVQHQDITCNRLSLVSDTREVYECVFEFDEEWNGYQKWAVFKQDERAYKVLLDNDTCTMPSEAIVDRGYMCVGVYGLLGDKRYPTIFTSPLLVQLGCIDGIYPPIPTPSEWEQALQYMAKIDEFNLLIPDTASEDNKLVDTDTLNVELAEIDLEKVDKVEGMGLSQNSFTNEEKSKLANLQNYDDTEIKQDIEDLQNGKVDKVSGKGLSQNDFTNALKTKLDGLENYDDSELRQEIQNLDNEKVDKVEGKVLSDNNFTTAEKTKLASLENYDDTDVKDSISALDERLDTAETDIDTIEAKIPNQASPTNQLADKSFVNSSIATNTAYFQGTFNIVDDLDLPTTATHEQVEAKLLDVVSNPTNNDYVFVYIPDSQGQIAQYDRYKYTTDDTSWNFEFTLNNSSFTAQQWEAINSGITSGLVALIGSALQPSDLTNYVKFDDYATASKGGTIKISSSYGTGMSNGFLKSLNKEYASYLAMTLEGFVSKGTLENVITGKDLQSGSQVDTKIANAIGNAIKTAYPIGE